MSSNETSTSPASLQRSGEFATTVSNPDPSAVATSTDIAAVPVKTASELDERLPRQPKPLDVAESTAEDWWNLLRRQQAKHWLRLALYVGVVLSSTFYGGYRTGSYVEILQHRAEGNRQISEQQQQVVALQAELRASNTTNAELRKDQVSAKTELSSALGSYKADAKEAQATIQRLSATIAVFDKKSNKECDLLRAKLGPLVASGVDLQFKFEDARGGSREATIRSELAALAAQLAPLNLQLENCGHKYLQVFQKSP